MAKTDNTDTPSYFSPLPDSTARRLERTNRLRLTDRGGREKSTSTARRHLLFAPVHYEPNYAYPLVILLHGPGRDERQLFEVMPRLSLRNYVAAAPRGLRADELESRTVRSNAGKKYRPLFDWPTTERGIEEAEDRIFDTMEKAQVGCHIAQDRVFLVGIGSGGTLAMRIGTKYPERFAGAVSLGGPFPVDHQPLGRWERIRSFPMLMTVGLKNRVFSPTVASEQLKLFYAAGMSVSIRQYNADDELLPQMFRDVNRWIMERVTATADVA